MDKVIVQVSAELQEIMPGYLENRKNDVLAIRIALNRSDYQAIEFIGHKMCGTGGGYGLEALGKMGGALEKAAKDRQAQSIQDLSFALESYLGRLQVTYFR